MDRMILSHTPGKVHPQAELEAVLAGGVGLYDVSHLLPAHPLKEYRRRSIDAIRRIYAHHSGMDDPHTDGFAALHVSANYSANVLNWPGTGYHYWVSRRADRDPLGRIVVYRANLDTTRSYHTGLLANSHGVGLALEGNTTQQALTHDMVEALEAFLPWARERYPKLASTWLSWHSEAGRFGGKPKPLCPGRNAREWLRAYRKAA